jgi:hypothetical protein
VGCAAPAILTDHALLVRDHPQFREQQFVRHRFAQVTEEPRRKRWRLLVEDSPHHLDLAGQFAVPFAPVLPLLFQPGKIPRPVSESPPSSRREALR